MFDLAPLSPPVADRCGAGDSKIGKIRPANGEKPSYDTVSYMENNSSIGKA